MFGKKEEPILVPMNGYPKSTIDIIEKNLINNTPVYDVNWEDVNAVSVDYITIRPSHPKKFPIEMNLMGGTPSEYIRAWKKGLGRFLYKDFGQKYKENGDTSNLSKYKFSPFVMQNSEGELVHFNSLIRFVDENDFKDEKEFEDMKKYNAISFSFKPKNSKEIKHCVVIKIFTKENNYMDECRLAFPEKIKNYDNYYSLEDYSMDVYGNLANDSDLEDEENINIVELPIESQKEFINEESLF